MCLPLVLSVELSDGKNYCTFNEKILLNTVVYSFFFVTCSCNGFSFKNEGQDNVFVKKKQPNK